MPESHTETQTAEAPLDDLLTRYRAGVANVTMIACAFSLEIGLPEEQKFLDAKAREGLLAWAEANRSFISRVIDANHSPLGMAFYEMSGKMPPEEDVVAVEQCYTDALNSIAAARQAQA